MTAAYTKRLKGHWNQGKAHKGDKEERQFSKREILEALKEASDLAVKNFGSPTSTVMYMTYNDYTDALLSQGYTEEQITDHFFKLMDEETK